MVSAGESLEGLLSLDPDVFIALSKVSVPTCVTCALIASGTRQIRAFRE